MTTLLRDIERLNACPEAIAWVRKQRGTRQQIWDRCPRADWLLWIAGRCCGKRGSKAHRAVVLACCACARTSLKFVLTGETRPLAAIELAERWARGDDSVTVKQIYAARVAARVAAGDAGAAAGAAWSAAGDAAGAAWSAARAARVAARVAAGDAAAAVGAAAHKRMARIVRKFIPSAPKIGRKP